jgi:hypothetical protein
LKEVVVDRAFFEQLCREPAIMRPDFMLLHACTRKINELITCPAI